MSVIEVIAAVFKVVGQILDLYSKNLLTQEQLDAAVAALRKVQLPPEA